MMNVMHPMEFECVPAGRFKRPGLAHRTLTHNQIAELSPGKRQMAYLVPFQAMDGEGWPRLRVQFAQANHPYPAYFTFSRLERRHLARLHGPNGLSGQRCPRAGLLAFRAGREIFGLSLPK